MIHLYGDWIQNNKFNSEDIKRNHKLMGIILIVCLIQQLKKIILNSKNIKTP